MKNLLKWLVPGMGLKRWIALTTLGVRHLHTTFPVNW